MIRISEHGIAFIKNWEGFRAEAYRDVGGIWTIGHGDTIHAKPGLICAGAEADQWMREFIKDFVEPKINTLVTVPLTQNQFDALCAFCYNLGTLALKESTLLKFLNHSEYQMAADEFPHWDHVHGVEIAGLRHRRLAERAMFLETANGNR